MQLALALPDARVLGLGRRAVAGVPGVVTGGVMLLVPEVVSQLAVEGSLDEGLHELLEQAVLPEQVIRLLVILQQLVEQFGTDRWHNQISFRD